MIVAAKKGMSLFFLIGILSGVLNARSALASMTDYELCLDEAFIQHDLAVKTAAEKYDQDLQYCYQYPIEQGYEECHSKAENVYRKELDRLRTILNLRKRACLKMPWSTF